MNVDLAGPSGRLEALLEEVEGARFAAVVCHPHPMMGGTMHTSAVHRLARALRTAGGTTLRFNYRGVGRSAGQYDQGRGEAEDARAALRHLRELCPGQPLVVSGFSFGAWMAVELAGEPGVVGLLLAGLPLRTAGLEELRRPERVRSVAAPLAVVQAEGDQFGTLPEVREALAGAAGPRWLGGVPGTTHLFTEDLAALEREAEKAIRWLLAQGPTPGGAAARGGEPRS